MKVFCNKKTMLLASALLVVAFLISGESFAFVDPIIAKGQTFLRYGLTFVRFSVGMVGLVIIGLALGGKINVRWIIITVVCAVLVSPMGWNGLMDYLGVGQVARQDDAGVY